MSHPLIRRLLVLMLAVLVTAGMGLSAVQTRTMNMNSMDLGTGMAMAGPTKCNDCGTAGDSMGTMACTAPACSLQMAVAAPPLPVLDLSFVPAQHPFQSRILSGRDTVPDPYPPRTSDIG